MQLKPKSDFGKFSPIFDGQIPASFEDKDIPALKRFAGDFVPVVIIEALNSGLQLITPRCGPGTVLSLLSGAVSPPIANAISVQQFVDQINNQNSNTLNARTP
jgi:hypothetical protein